MPLGLAKLKTSLGCKSASKGCSPLNLNNDAHIDLIFDHIPNLECFRIDSMQEQQKESFLAWYEEKKNEPFHILQNLVEYCIKGEQMKMRQGEKLVTNEKSKIFLLEGNYLTLSHFHQL